ncbi:MAG: histidine kinase, partial [Ignavibacteria bacterium]
GEFGKLIKAFNTMAAQLKKNSAELASLEREVAWKEMAKQVAHEIKNPLTPMKLSVQHLKAAYRDKSEKFGEIFEKVTDTIINQIETLGRISSEFSNVAKMPKLNLQTIKLEECIRKATDLFDHENIKIEILGEIDDLKVNADEDQLKRSIINLIRNSIQANSSNVIIKVSDDKDEVSIDISDDGSGIPSENQDKIFELNFTTKTGGMGLGLSMAKRFMESIDGNLFLVKSDSNGTTFRIKLRKAEDG